MIKPRRIKWAGHAKAFGRKARWRETTRKTGIGGQIILKWTLEI
jgi:hypothetical protein